MYFLYSNKDLVDMELGKLEHVFHLLPPYNPVTCSLVPLRRLLLHLAVGSSLEGHPPVYERWHSHLQHNSWLFETLDTYFFPARIESWILYDMWWRSTKIIARNESEFLIISLLSLQKKNPHIVVIDSHCEFSLLYIGTNVVAITLHGDRKEDWRFYQKKNMVGLVHIEVWSSQEKDNVWEAIYK